MVDSDTSKYDTVVMEDSDDEERDYNFKTLYRHMHSEAKRKYVNSSCEVAKNNRNIRLNRYNNVAPYDSHRVVLSTVDETDYINASEANSSSDPHQLYILAQGPLNRTCGDFWRMSWEKNCYRIIMLNKLMENGRVKCARYWPEQVNGKLNFEVGGVMYSVTLLDEKFDANRFIIRHIELRRIHANGEEKREITHFHYIAWPDFGVPDTPKDFGDFFYTLEAHHCFSNKSSPSIVHCSAGIGRTGTLILVDSCLKKLRKEQRGMLELPDLIQQAYEEIIYLRQFRMGLIQTADQFEFSIRSIEYLHNDHLKRRELELPKPIKNAPLEDPLSSGDGEEIIPPIPSKTPPTTNIDSFTNDPAAPNSCTVPNDKEPQRSPSPSKEPIRIEEGPLNALISPL